MAAREEADHAEDEHDPDVEQRRVEGVGADADQVNANFQYLQDNLATLVSILEQQGTITAPVNRFAGTYSLSGISVLFETGSCGPSHVNGMVLVSDVSGTATSDGTSLTLNTSEPAARLFIGIPSTADTTTISYPPDILPVSATGAIDTVGQFSADGSTFFASALDTETNSGCTENSVTHISGVRIP